MERLLLLLLLLALLALPTHFRAVRVQICCICSSTCEPKSIFLSSGLISFTGTLIFGVLCSLRLSPRCAATLASGPPGATDVGVADMGDSNGDDGNEADAGPMNSRRSSRRAQLQQRRKSMAPPAASAAGMAVSLDQRLLHPLARRLCCKCCSLRTSSKRKEGLK